MTDDNSCFVEYIDSRPIGYAFYGDADSLSIGDSTWSENRFYEAEFMVDVTEENNYGLTIPKEF